MADLPTEEAPPRMSIYSSEMGGGGVVRAESGRCRPSNRPRHAVNTAAPNVDAPRGVRPAVTIFGVKMKVTDVSSR